MRVRSGGRPAITLLEVLAAIFIMGIGMLAILVLFPLGALNMARALKDDRCGTIAQNAHAMANALNLRNDPNITPLLAYNNPPAGLLFSDQAAPGYPVFVDAYYGVALGASAALPNVGATGVRRVKPSYVTTIADCDRWFSFNDDLTFTLDGRPGVSPQTAAGPLTEPTRQGLYTWSYMLRRQKSGDANTTELYVIVYSGRDVLAPTQETAYSVVPGSAQGALGVTIIWDPATQEKPALRRGAWILDTSYVPKANTGGGPGGRIRGSINGRFYRVMESTDTSGTTITVQVEPPLRNAQVSQVVVLENAVEVFERGVQ